MWRLKKQLTYSLPVIVLFIFFIYILIPKPKPTCFDGKKNQGEEGIDCGGPCELSCEVRSLVPIEIESGQAIFYPQSKNFDLVGLVKNLNKEWALDKATAIFYIYDITGQLKNKVTAEKISVLPKEVRYVVSLDLVKPSDYKIGKVELELKYNEFNWKKTEWEKHPLNVSSYKIDGDIISLTVSNETQQSIFNSELIIILLDENNKIVGLTKSFLEETPPLSSKDLLLNLPTKDFRKVKFAFHFTEI